MNKIVTISREFGSGGKEIGKRLSDKLGFAFYDNSIIAEIAKETGMCEEYIEKISNSGVYPYAFQFGKSFTSYPLMQINQTEILVKQQEIIKRIAEKGNAIIVGRGADAILKDYDSMNIFVYSDMESRINRCKSRIREEEKDYTDSDFEKKIKQIDKDRKRYYELVSDMEWGKKEHYHLCINTRGVEIKTIIPGLAEYIDKWFGGTEK